MIRKCTILLLVVFQTIQLFPQTSIKNIDADTSKPKYSVLLDYMEFSLLSDAMHDGISKYKGNIEFETNAKYNNNEVSWEITTSNKLVFEVLNLYTSQKSMEFLKIIDINNASSIEKKTIASLRSLSIKLDDALKNPIWSLQKFSVILTKESGHYYISSTDIKEELTGKLNKGLDSIINKKVTISGFRKESGKFELSSIHLKKENTLELFIMSQCPYGIQALKTILDNDNLLSSKMIKLEVHYIFSKNNNTYTSLHGEQEIVEDIVQMLVRDKNPTCFIEYLKQRILFSTKSWEEIAIKAKLDKKDIQGIKTEISNNRNSLIQSEYQYMINNYQLINSSPTYIWESEIVNSLSEIPGFQIMHSNEKCTN